MRLESSSGNYLIQAPCTQQFQLEEFSQCYIQSGLNTLQNGGSTTMLCNQFSHSTPFAINYWVWGTFLCFILCLLPLYWAPLRFISHLYSSLTSIYTCSQVSFLLRFFCFVLFRFLSRLSNLGFFNLTSNVDKWLWHLNLTSLSRASL